MIGPNVKVGNGCKIQDNVSTHDGVELADVQPELRLHQQSARRCDGRQAPVRIFGSPEGYQPNDDSVRALHLRI